MRKMSILFTISLTLFTFNALGETSIQNPTFDEVKTNLWFEGINHNLEHDQNGESPDQHLPEELTRVINNLTF